jgi:hypothetical protein
MLEIPEELATHLVSFLDAALGTHPEGLGMPPLIPLRRRVS